MPLDQLPGSLVLPGRDQERERYLRDYRLRNPTAATGPGTLPYVDARVMADTTTVTYANAATIANAATRATRTGTQLDDDGEELGRPRRGAVGAAGAVTITAGASGTTILQGDEFKINGIRYECAFGGDFQDGQPVSIVGVDTGPGTVQRAGTAGKWTSPRPGCSADAVVYQQSDGSGLSGGADAESDDDYRAALDAVAANPPASGNDAEYQQIVERTPNVAVQQAFTVMGIKGPGSVGVLFTLRPSQSGASRVPNATHMNLVLAWIKGQMPAADGIYMCTLVPNPVNVNLKVQWGAGAANWADTQPWPPYESTQIAVDGAHAISATSFYVTGNNGSNPAPVAGQTIGVFDLPNLVFRKKKILTVTPSGTDWILAIDTTPGLSDVGYAPLAGQIVCPWSDSLNSVVGAVTGYFDTLGPGEQVSSFVDPGLRQRRSPPNPSQFPSTLSNRLLEPVFELENIVQDAILQDPTAPYATPVGTPGVSANLTTLACLACFPE